MEDGKKDGEEQKTVFHRHIRWLLFGCENIFMWQLVQRKYWCQYKIRIKIKKSLSTFYQCYLITPLTIRTKCWMRNYVFYSVQSLKFESKVNKMILKLFSCWVERIKSRELHIGKYNWNAHSVIRPTYNL